MPEELPPAALLALAPPAFGFSSEVGVEALTPNFAEVAALRDFDDSVPFM